MAIMAIEIQTGRGPELQPQHVHLIPDQTGQGVRLRLLPDNLHQHQQGSRRQLQPDHLHHHQPDSQTFLLPHPGPVVAVVQWGVEVVPWVEEDMVAVAGAAVAVAVEDVSCY